MLMTLFAFSLPDPYGKHEYTYTSLDYGAYRTNLNDMWVTCDMWQGVILTVLWDK